MDGVIESLQYGVEPEDIIHNLGYDGKKVDHIVYSSLLAVCSK